MPAGQTPHSVSLHTYGDLVDSVQPGDRVIVTGVYRAQPLRANPKMRNVKSVYRTHVDVLHFDKEDGKRQKLYETADDEDSQVEYLLKFLKKSTFLGDIYILVAIIFAF